MALSHFDSDASSIDICIDTYGIIRLVASSDQSTVASELFTGSVCGVYCRLAACVRNFATSKKLSVKAGN